MRQYPNKNIELNKVKKIQSIVWKKLTDFNFTVQPADSDIQIGGIDGDLTEGDVVTASCTVNRLYPEIASVGSFSMTWGENTNSSYEKHDPVGTDKAFKYTVTMTKKLKSTDDGTTIECNLQPEIGTAAHKKETAIVKCKYILLYSIKTKSILWRLFYQRKTGFIREKQGLSEKNRVYQSKTLFFSDKPCFSLINPVFHEQCFC